MPLIKPIEDLRNTDEISDLAHKEQQPIFITKNGYSDLVIISAELYDKMSMDERIDQAIYSSEKEVSEGALPIRAEVFFDNMEKKYFA